jgi:hypothetical protein
MMRAATAHFKVGELEEDGVVYIAKASTAKTVP